MKLSKRIDNYVDCFETGTRDNGEVFVYLKDSAPEELKDSVRDAHGDRLPNDWTYSTYLRLLESLGEYTELSTIDDIEEYRNEIVDAVVDPYTSDLTAWLHDNVNNVYYLTDALEETEYRDGFTLLSAAQYRAIDEIMSSIVTLLSEEDR